MPLTVKTIAVRSACDRRENDAPSEYRDVTNSVMVSTAGRNKVQLLADLSIDLYYYADRFRAYRRIANVEFRFQQLLGLAPIWK